MAKSKHFARKTSTNKPPKKLLAERLTQLLAKWAGAKRSVPTKPRKEMTEEELKTWKTGRNRQRRRRKTMLAAARAMGKSLGNRPPALNTCRRRRLATKHPERQ